MLRWKGSSTKSFDLKCARKPVPHRASEALMEDVIFSSRLHGMSEVICTPPTTEPWM